MEGLPRPRRFASRAQARGRLDSFHAFRTELPMTGSLVLRFGEMRLAMVAAGEGLSLAVPPEYEAFLDAGSEAADCTFEWRIGSVAIPAGAPLVESEIWRAWSHPDGREEIVFFWGGGDPYLSVVFDREFRRARVTRIAQDADPDALNVAEYPFSEYVASRLLARQGAVELHASSIVVDGRAYLFVGHSGAGKTTISLVAEAGGAGVLSDDRTIVRIGPDGPVAWGTPWHGTGKRSSPGSAPVDGVFLIRQARENRVEPMKDALAVKELFVRSIQANVQEGEVTACLATLERLATEFGVQWLHFTPAVEVLQVIVAAGYANRVAGSVLAPAPRSDS